MLFALGCQQWVWDELLASGELPDELLDMAGGGSTMTAINSGA